jgi:CheY-like chemotaxis protein
MWRALIARMVVWTDEQPRAMKPIRVLLIDETDTRPDFLPLEGPQGGMRVLTEHASSPAAVEQALHWFKPDLVLSDFGLPGFDALQALELVRRLCPGVPFVFVSDTPNEAQALAALRHGAFDHVPKNDHARMMSVLRHALNEASRGEPR